MKDIIKLYIYNKEGFHSPPIYIKNTLENVSKAIARGINVPMIQLVDSLDYEVLRTLGEYIDICNDDEYLDTILPVLIPMQEGEKDPFEGEIEYYYDRDNQLTKEEFNVWILDKFNYILSGKEIR